MKTIKNKKLRIVSIFVGLLLVFSTVSMAADELCMVSLSEQDKLSHVSVENCTNIGVFSVGTYQDGWRSLTYRYPKPWKGTYLTLWVDGKLYSNSLYSTGAVHMDEYVLTKPQRIDSDTISTKWRLPEGIDVEQVVKVADGGAIIAVKVINNCGKSINVGGRLSVDLMVDGNDGAPVSVPGRGVMVKEFSYSGEEIDFDYLIAQDRAVDPGLTRNIQIAYGSEKPTRVTFANWKTGRSPDAWEYTIDPSRSTELDSAIILYYGPNSVAPGQALEFTVYSGKKVEPTCSDSIKNQGETGVDCGGPCSPCALGRSCIKDSDCVSGYCSDNVCEERPVVPTTAPKPPISFDLLAILLIIAVILLIVFAVYLRKPKAPAAVEKVVPVTAAVEKVVPVRVAKGQVTVDKERKDNRITITVTNSSSDDLSDCILVETVPPGAEIKFIGGKNVNKRRHQLVWNIGDLKAGGKAILEYTTNSEKASKIENFSFLSKNPIMAKVNGE